MKKALVVAVAFMAALGFTGMAAAQVTPTEDAGDTSVNGGNTSNTNFSATQDTTDWAGFYGTLDPTVQLNDGSTFYQWTGGNVSGSAILASQGSFSGDKADLSAPSDPSSLTGVPSGGVAGVNNTYTGSNSFDLLVDSTPTNSTVVDEGTGTSSFNNYLYSDTNSNAVFAAEAIEGGEAFNGDTADYQLLVGTTDDDDGTENFSFYAEIQ